MKKLHFQLFTNNESVIDKYTNFYEKENTLFFSIENDLYEFNKDKNILKKKNKESIIIIDISLAKLYIETLPEHYEFTMDLESIKFDCGNEKIQLEYTFISDGKTTNCIIIDY